MYIWWSRPRSGSSYLFIFLSRGKWSLKLNTWIKIHAKWICHRSHLNCKLHQNYRMRFRVHQGKRRAYLFKQCSSQTRPVPLGCLSFSLLPSAVLQLGTAVDFSADRWGVGRLIVTGWSVFFASPALVLMLWLIVINVLLLPWPGLSVQEKKKTIWTLDIHVCLDFRNSFWQLASSCLCCTMLNVYTANLFGYCVSHMGFFFPLWSWFKWIL